MLNKARTLRDVIKSGDMCPYCRSTEVVEGVEAIQPRDLLDGEIDKKKDWACTDCEFRWDADGVYVPEDKPIPAQV